MKYFATDLGNVICEVNFDYFIRELSRVINVSIEDVNYFLNRTQRLHDLGLTVISDELRDHFKIKSPVIIENLMAEWNKTIKPNHQMVSFLTNLLRSGDVKIALLSNIGVEHAVMMREVLTKEVFDSSVKFFSCEVGARKPSYLYYKLFLDMNPEFKGCVYLDDRIENIESGFKFGFNARHFVLDSYINQSQRMKNLLDSKLEYIGKLIEQS